LFFNYSNLPACLPTYLPGQRIVYIDGAFDMFHAGHIQVGGSFCCGHAAPICILNLPHLLQTLEKARALGDYLIVGIHNDANVNRRRGRNYPIMNLNER
jgi:ethanolamine-phosphate cytidylyltransferase